MPGFNPLVPKGPGFTHETHRKHRYVWDILASTRRGTSWQAISVHAFKCGRPSVEFDEVIIHHGQEEIYRPGKHRWRPVEISFYEGLYPSDPPKYSSWKNGCKLIQGISPPLTANVSEFIYTWWAAYTDPTRHTKGKPPSSILSVAGLHHPPFEYYRTCRLSMLDGVDRPTWQYRLLDCWPTKVTPSDLSYTDSDIAEITVTLRFNKAIESITNEEEEEPREYPNIPRTGPRLTPPASSR